MNPHCPRLRAGEQFNPRYEACGFFPDEIVGRRLSLTDGQKYLYSRMVRWARLEDGNRPNERAGEVWRAHSTIAEELGKSEKQVSRDLAKLESEGFMGHRTRDGRKSNTYFFLFHPDFERTSMSGQMNPPIDFERTPASVQIASVASVSSHLNGHPRPVTTDLNGHPCPPNPKVFNHKGESSSSTEQNGRLEDPAKLDAGSTTATTIPFSQQGNLRPAPREWAVEEFLDCRRALQRHFGAPMLPDLELTRDVLGWMQNADDVRFWLLDLTARRVKPRGWGFYRNDAETWPQRRSDVCQQVEENLRMMEASGEEAKEAMEAEDIENEAAMALHEQQKRDRAKFLDAATAKGWRRVQPKSGCLNCYGFGLRDIETSDVCDCEAGRKLEHARSWCDRCANTGVMSAPDDPRLAAWCECSHAVQRRALEPTLVEDDNKRRRALISSAIKPAKVSAPIRMRSARSLAGVLATSGERRASR